MHPPNSINNTSNAPFINNSNNGRIPPLLVNGNCSDGGTSSSVATKRYAAVAAESSAAATTTTGFNTYSDQPKVASKAATLYSDLLESVTRWNARANRQRRERLPYVDNVTGQSQRDNHLRQYRRETRLKGGLQSGQVVSYPPQCRWRVEKRPYNYYYNVSSHLQRSMASNVSLVDDGGTAVDEMLTMYEDQQHQLYAAAVAAAAPAPVNVATLPSAATIAATPLQRSDTTVVAVSGGVVAGILSGVELKTHVNGGAATRSSIAAISGVNGNPADDVKPSTSMTSMHNHRPPRAQREYSQELRGDDADAILAAQTERSLMDFDDADGGGGDVDDEFDGVDAGAKDDEDDDDYHGSPRRNTRGSARIKRGAGSSQTKVRRMAADRTYPCQDCGKIFKSRQGLRYHMQSCPPDGNSTDPTHISNTAGRGNSPSRQLKHSQSSLSQRQQPRHSTPHSSASSSSQHSTQNAANTTPTKKPPASVSHARPPILPPQQQALPPHIPVSHHQQQQQHIRQQQQPLPPPPVGGPFSRPPQSAYPPPSALLHQQQQQQHPYPPPLASSHQHHNIPASSSSHNNMNSHQHAAAVYGNQPLPPPTSSSYAMGGPPMPHHHLLHHQTAQPPPLPPPPPTGPSTNVLQPGGPPGMYGSGAPYPPSAHAPYPPPPPPSNYLYPPPNAPYPQPYSHALPYGPPPPPNYNSDAPSQPMRPPFTNPTTTAVPPSNDNAAAAIYPPPSLLSSSSAVSGESSSSYYAGNTNNNNNNRNGAAAAASDTSYAAAKLSSSSTGRPLDGAPAPLLFDDRHLPPPKTYCDVCKGTAQNNTHTGKAESMISCSQCRHSAHPTCLSFTDDMVSSIRTYNWQCIECKVCVKCGTSDNDDQLLFCDLCDRGYHLYCLKPPLKAPPEGKWFCELCQHRTTGGSSRNSAKSQQNDGSHIGPTTTTSNHHHHHHLYAANMPASRPMNSMQHDSTTADAPNALTSNNR